MANPTGSNTTSVYLGGSNATGGGVAFAGFFTGLGTQTDDDTTEKVLGTFTIPANAFVPPQGSVIVRMRLLGLFGISLDGQGNPNDHEKRVRVYFGSDLIIDFQTADPTVAAYDLEILAVGNTMQQAFFSGLSFITLPADGMIDVGVFNQPGAVQSTRNLAVTTADASQDIVVSVTGQNGSSTGTDSVPSDKDISFSAGWVEFLNSAT